MQALRRTWLLVVVSLCLCPGGTAQTPAKPVHKPLPWKGYCHGNDGFCFKYPPPWTVLGEVFGGNGVVVAPPQRQERSLWDEITVALVIPSPRGDEDPVTIDQAIAKAISSVQEGGQSVETLQRQQRTVDDKPAQLLKLHYVEKPSGREWTEELVFIEGPDAEIYSVALKCAPSSLLRMEPIFLRIVDSWTLPEVEPVPRATDEDAAPGLAPTTKPPTNPASPPESVPPKTSTPPNF